MCAPLTPYPATPAEFAEYQDWWSLMYASETEEEETPAGATPENLNPQKKVNEP